MVRPGSPANPRIVSVLGLLPDAQKGRIDGHTHVWIQPAPGTPSGGPTLNDPERSLAEVRAFAQAGGAALVDCQPGGAGRDGRRLAWLSQASSVPIVACTGFHRRRYYPAVSTLWTRDSDDLTELMVSELDQTIGLEECRGEPRPVAAGFIKVAIEATMADSPLGALAAAAHAAAITGAAVQIHTEQGAAAEEVVTFFTERGVSPRQLLVCHIDKRPDRGLHVALAQLGVNLEYDTFFRPKYNPEQHLWPLIDHMVSAGHASAVVLATDLADATQWESYGGGPGLAAFPTQIPARLTARGVSPESIDLLTGGNIARLLARPVPLP